MKPIAVIALLMVVFGIVSLVQSQSPQSPPGVKSSYETLSAPVLKVYSIKDGEHRFVAYVVK